MLAVEEMQSMQRAENGIKEIVIGYADYDETEPDVLDPNEIAAFGDAYETTIAELPEDLRDILLAEQHRLKTGEVVGVEQFAKRRKEVGLENG